MAIPNGPADCLVVEMLSRLPTEMIYEVTHGFQKRFQGGLQNSRGLANFELGVPQEA